MTYFAAFKAYLSKSAVEPDSQSFPCLCELREFHPSEPMTECDPVWHFFVNADSRERLLDELSFLDSFLLERIRQLNSSKNVLYEDSVLSRWKELGRLCVDMTQSQLTDLEIDVKSQIDELEGKIAVLSRLRGDVSFQQSIASQLLSQLRRVASLEELKAEAAGKKEIAAKELKEIMKQVSDRKVSGRKLHEALEKSMSHLFEGLKVTIVGDETVLCCVCSDNAMNALFYPFVDSFRCLLDPSIVLTLSISLILHLLSSIFPFPFSSFPVSITSSSIPFFKQTYNYIYFLPFVLLFIMLLYFFRMLALSLQFGYICSNSC